jgi:sulfate/thiosulfate transport system permease protein
VQATAETVPDDRGTARRKRARNILPGFGLTMGYTLTYLSLIVLIPIAAMFLKAFQMPWETMRAALTDGEMIASIKLTFGLALVAAFINVFFGTITAWTLVRYPFFGRRIFDALIDLPFALPTAVSGITLATIFSQPSSGWLGNLGGNLVWIINGMTWKLFGTLWLAEDALAWMNLNFSYTRVGMLMALVFIGLPFVVRTLQPTLEDLDPEVEEAASSLGATPAQAFWRVTFPTILPSLIAGFALSFARAVGEYGSVIFISSNLPFETEITAHLIWKKLGNFDYPGATMLGVIMLVLSFVILLIVNGLQWWSTQRGKA